MELEKREKYNACPEYDMCLNNGTKECDYCSYNFTNRGGHIDYYCTRTTQSKYIKGYED